MKRWIRIVLAGLAVALAVWTAVWMHVARGIAGRVADWQAAQAEAGVAVAFDRLDIKGWPFGWRATAENPSARGAGAARWEWSGERLVASLDPRDLKRVAFRVPGEQRVRFGAGDLATSLALRAARPEGALALDDRGRVDRLELDLEALEIVADGAAAPLQIHTLALMLAPHRPAASDHTTDTLDLTLRAAGVRLPAPVAPLEGLGRDVASASLDLRVRGRIAGAALGPAVAAWRDDGGTLDIRRLSLAWGPLLLDGDATLALDAENRPIGAASVRIAGFVETVDALAASGTIRPAIGAGLKIALTLMARPDPDAGGRPRATIPMTAQDGIFSVDRFRLFAVPPLKLD